MGNSCYDLAQLDWKIEENESVLIWVSGNWTKQISGKQNIERTILNWLEGKYNDWCKHPFPVCWIPLQSKQLLPASVETTAKSDAQLMLVSLPAALPTKSSSSHPEVLPAGPGFSEGGRGGALHVPPQGPGSCHCHAWLRHSTTPGAALTHFIPLLQSAQSGSRLWQTVAI